MGEAYSHKKDNQKPAAKPALKPAPEVSAECAKSRQETGMTIAVDLSTPQTPKQKEQGESEKVNDYFKKMKEEFLALGVELPVDFYKGAYYALVKKEKRPAIELVYGRMNMFFLKARESVLAKTILHDRSKDLLKILEFHLLGKTDEALKHEVELFDNIDTKISINNIETTIGTKFSDKQAKEFLSLLNSNGIDSKTANKYIGEIKKMSPENFNSLKGSQDLFIQHLLVLMLTLKAVGPNAKDFVKAELEIAAKFTQEFIANKRITNKKYLDQKQAKIDAPYNAAHFEMAQALTVNRRELAINYLRKSGKKIKYENAKTVINEIFQAKNSNDIKNLSQKYQIEIPATLGVLQNAESKFETANIDKLVGGDKGEVEEKLALESDKLIDVSDKLATRIDAEALYFENLLAKYSDISAVPAKEKRTTAIRLQGYLQLLNQHTVIQGRLLSIAASYDLMGSRPQKKPGDTETRPWETIVKEIREEAENSNNEAEMVAAFLKVEKYESPDLNIASLSPLTINLIQKENSGLERKYKGIMNSVSGSYENLGNIMGQFEKAQADPDWAEKNGTKLVRIFKQGSEAYAKIMPEIGATRGKFENMKTDLASALAKVEKGDSPLLKLHPQLKKVYANILQNAIKSVNEILDNPNSPISTQQLKKLQDGQKEFEEARTAFLNGVLKNIGAFTIIMATSIVGAMGGAYLITTMLKTSSIFIVPVGTSLGGVIGSRVGMTITDTTGLTEYGAENIWNAKEMGKDFVWGYGLSLGALLAAKGTISALGVASHSKNATVAARASSMLKTIQKAKTIISPFEKNNAKTALTRFGAKFREEYAEETIEEAIAEVGKMTDNPYLEYFAMVVNGSDGKNVKLNMAGVNTNKVGIATEGNTITYTTKTPEEFIANLSSQFVGRKGGSFDSKINPDGSVKLSIYGPSLRQSIAEMTIYPATETATVNQSVEVKTDSAKSTALDLATKIPDSPIMETAKEIANELFGDTVKISKDAFLTTAAKFKSISTYLKSNAKELATIFDTKFNQQGVTFGMSGAQILQAIYETVAEFAGKKVDIQKVNRKFKVGDAVVYTNGRGGLTDVFIKAIDSQTGEVTLRTTDLSGYEVKVPAEHFLAFNKKRQGTVAETEMNVSDYKIGDIVNVMINGKIERGKWKIVGMEDGWSKRIILQSQNEKIHIDPKDIMPKKTEDIEPTPDSEKPNESKYLTDQEQQLLEQLFPEGIDVSHFKQSSTGNCYVLSFLHSFKRHPLAPIIIAKMIKPAHGGWDVKFSGDAEAIFVPEGQLLGKYEWDEVQKKEVLKETVTGQLGDRILVLAHAKWRIKKTYNYKPGQTMIASEGGFAVEPMELFLKAYSSEIYPLRSERYDQSFNENSSETRALNLLNAFSKNPRDYILTASPPSKKTPYSRHIGGEFNTVMYYMDSKYRFVQQHSYSIIAVNAITKTVTIANPHDTKGKEYTLTYKEFFKYFGDIDVVKIDPNKMNDIDFMKAPYIDGVTYKIIQRTIETRFNAQSGLSIKLGPSSIVPCELQSDGSIFLNMQQATGIGGGPIIKPGEELIVGRGTIPNMPNTVSASHVKIKNLGNGYFTVIDLNSSNGTTVQDNINYSEGITDTLLKPGNPFKFNAQSGLSIKLGPKAIIPCLFGGNGSIYLYTERATGLPGILNIKPGEELIVGRDTIPGMPNTVSASHVKIKNLGNYFTVTDLNSTNGTTVIKH